MENASKALLIAGAILIAILLISVAIIVMNSTNDTIDQAQDTAASQAQQMFNSNFTGYLGNGQKAASVKSLMTAVASSNGTNADHQVTVQYGGITKEAGEIQSLVSNQSKYKVEATYGGDGYISIINVTEETKTTNTTTTK